VKQEYPNRDAREKLVPGSLNFVAPARRGVNCVGGVEDRGCCLVRDGQATFLHIRIAGGTGAGPDEVGRLFHRLS